MTLNGCFKTRWFKSLWRANHIEHCIELIYANEWCAWLTRFVLAVAELVVDCWAVSLEWHVARCDCSVGGLTVGGTVCACVLCWRHCWLRVNDDDDDDKMTLQRCVLHRLLRWTSSHIRVTLLLAVAATCCLSLQHAWRHHWHCVLIRPTLLMMVILDAWTTYLALRSSGPCQDNGQQDFAICSCL